jgi:hypothetical protein
MALLIGLGVMGGCDDTTPSEEQREEIERVVRGYLNALSEAYAEVSIEPLDGWAADIERSEVQRLLRKLVQTTGDRAEATLLQIDIEKIEMFRAVNASVTLTEVWDLRRIDVSDGREIGRNPHSVQHSIINLRRIDGEWLVVGRIVQETAGGSRWRVTPQVTPSDPSDPAEESVD